MDCREQLALIRRYGGNSNALEALARIEDACERSEAWGGATPNEHALADIAAIVGEERESAEPATIAFVRRFAICETYGGGQRARIRLGKGVELESLDGWDGPDALMCNLALKLEDHMNRLA